MPVNVDPLQITPYTSTVPLVQIPPDQMSAQTRPAQPLAGEFGKKGTGAMAIGDSLLKGFMLGHQQKEQKKNMQAQATINAADAASEAAYKTYQDALTKAQGKQDDPAAKAAYDAYVTAFQAGKQAKAQFVIPEKTQKGKKAAGDTDPVKSPDGKKKPASAGFNNIKDFFEANPHIVPQIALVTMQPKPPGLAPQGQEQVQNLESQKLSNQQRQQEVATAKQKQDDLNFVALHQSLTPEQVQGLPSDELKQLSAAKFRLEQQQSPHSKFATWQSQDGKQFLVLPDGEQPPPGYSPYEKTTAGTGLGSESWVLKRAAQLWGIPAGELTPADKNYLDAMAAYAKKRAQLTASASGSSTNVQGDRESWIRQQIGPPPAAPSGRSPIDAATFQQGLQPPPGSSGGIGKPPTVGAAPTAQGVPSTAPQGSTQFTVGVKPQGMVEEGNIPVWNRPSVDNGDGTHSSEYSTSFEQDGKEVLVPTVVNGKFLTPDGKKPKPGSPEEKAMFKAAWQNYLKTGENLGKFANSKDADSYANTLHNRGAAKGGISKPPQAGKTAQTAKTAQGGIAPPPRGKETATTAAVTRQAVTKQQEGYRKAETAHAKALADADKAFAAAQKTAATSGDPSIIAEAQKARDRAITRAELDLEEAKASVAQEYDAAVKSIGGTPGSQNTGNLPPGWQ